MKYAYFPGCLPRSSAHDYHLSFTFVARALGIDLVELRDWVCCGAESARATSTLLSVALPALNLSYAEQDGFEKLVAPCSVCISRFRAAETELKHDQKLKAKVDKVLEYPYQGKVEVYHPLEVLSEIGIEKIGQRMRKKLSGIRIACYYGCLLARPPQVVRSDNPENPSTMDAILRRLGAETLDWSLKTGCCGASMALTHSDVALKLSNDILREAKNAGADALAVACPFCHLNLDSRQSQMEEVYRVHYSIPVLYITQWIGLAFGAYPEEVGIQKLVTSPREVLGSIGLM